MVSSVKSTSFLIPSCIEPIKQTLYDIVRKIFEAPCGYFLKISVFRQEAMQGTFEQNIIQPLVLTIENLWRKIQGAPPHAVFDAERLNKSAAFLSEFAEVRTLTTSDGQVLEWTLYRPEKFQQWIEDHGGVRIGDKILPRGHGDWERLKRLGEFKWFEQVGQSFHIPKPVAGANHSCVLRLQGFGRTMPMDKAFIGVHLAAGFNYALFNWRKELSLKGYAEDAEGCYQALLREGFAPNQIKIMASCRGTFPAVQLKERHHAEGIDAILIQPPPSLSAVIANQPFPVSRIAMLGLGAIEKDGEHYDSIRRLRGLSPSSGRLCLVVSEGDTTLPADTEQQFRQSASHAGPYYAIWEHQRQDGKDAHFEEPLRNSEIFHKYTEFLAGRVP